MIRGGVRLSEARGLLIAFIMGCIGVSFTLCPIRRVIFNALIVSVD
jgi:hypothetical protein